MDIRHYRDTHQQVLRQIDQLRGLIRGGIPANSAAISELLVNIASGIKFHLAAEDKVLYPTLARSGDSIAMEAGERYQQEMKGLSAAFGELVIRWRVPSRVAADPEGFRSHANTVFKALFERIMREERELYPIAEQV